MKGRQLMSGFQRGGCRESGPPPPRKITKNKVSNILVQFPLKSQSYQASILCWVINQQNTFLPVSSKCHVLVRTVIIFLMCNFFIVCTHRFFLHLCLFFFSSAAVYDTLMLTFACTYTKQIFSPANLTRESSIAVACFK